MSTGSLTFLDSQRKGSSLLPVIMYGYLYTKYNSLLVCCVVVDIPLVKYTTPVLTLEPVWLLGLAVTSLFTGTCVYTISVSEKSATSIKEGAGRFTTIFINGNLWISLLSFIFAGPLLLVRICQGDLAINTLLLVWSGIVLTAIWSRFLNKYANMEEIKGFMN